MRFTKSLLIGSASILATLVAASPSFAQTAPAADTTVDELVITGIRASLQQSLETKRNADTLVEVITAEDIGKFPDKNVAESLQRVPGVTIQREFGEGERVSIRGSAPTLNRTLLNGHAIATADWFILDQLKASRSFNYLMLPSEIVGKVEVYKSPRADIDEGGVGGTVDVSTRRPLDLDAFTVSASAQAVFDEKADTIDPAASGLISWHNEDKSLGALLGVIYQKRTFRRDGIEILGYTDRVVGGQTVAAPDLIGSTLFRQERERTGVNFAIQFAPTDRFDVELTGFYSKMDADNFNQNYMAWISQMFGAGSPLLNPVIKNGTLVGGEFALNPGANGVVFDAIDRIATTDTRSIDLNGRYRITDDLTLSGRIGYTDATGATEQQPFWETNAPTGLTFDLSRGVPRVSFADIDPETADDEMILGWASNNRFVNDDNEFYVFADLDWDVDFGALTSIKGGIKYTDHDRDVEVTYGQRRTLLNWTAPGLTACNGHVCTLADVQGGLTPSDFLDGIGGAGVLTSYLQASQGKIEGIYAALPKAAIWNSDFGAVQDPGCVGLLNCNHFGPLESFTLNEKTFGGYLLGRFEGDGWRGNIGVRVVQTKVDTEAWLVGVPVTAPGAVNNPFGVIAPNAQSKEYTDVLPSLNFNFDLTEDLVLRIAAARVMARPDYAQMAGFVSLTPTLLTGSGGNPDLDPYRANQFDASLEWYFAPQSLLSAAYFYKDISTYIVQGGNIERQPLEANNPADPRITNPANNCTPNGPNLYTCDYRIGRPINVAGGRVQGIELSYQQPIWNGFGIIANYTYSDGESDSDVPIPSLSKHAYNLTGYYENDRLSVRLSYNYRSEFFADYDAERGFRALYVDETTSLDGSISFNLTENAALTFDAINLADEQIEEYYDDDKGRPARFYLNGRTFFAGVRISF